MPIITRLQHSWVMPLSSTLSILWIFGALFYAPRSRILFRHFLLFIAGHDTLFFNILAHTLRFFGLVPHAPQRAPAQPAPPHRGAGADPAPAIRRDSSSQGNHVIMREGEFYAQGIKINGIGENLECAICFDSLKQSEDGSAPAVKVLKCSHVFHSHCIADWFVHNMQCPTCRDATSNLRNLRDFFFK